MKSFRHLAALLFLTVLCGCEPKERVQWSPDGSRALVLLDYRLYFADGQGPLSAPLPDEDEEPGRLLYHASDWLPDGSGLVVERIRLAPRWEDLQRLMPEGEMQRCEDLAARLPTLLSAAVLLHGDADRVDQILARLSPADGEAMGNALRYSLETDLEAVRAALGGAPRALASLDQTTGSETGYLLHELALVRPEAVEKTVVLARSFRGVHSLRVSPRQDVVACARPTRLANRFDLEVFALDGSAPTEIAREITQAYDWTPDGTSLIYMEPLSPEGGTVMRIRRGKVLDEKGRPLVSAVQETAAEDLAYALLPFSPRLAVLPDGKILFASQPGNLPVRGGVPGVSARFYLLAATGGDPVVVPTAEGALPMDLGHFVLSPDGRQVAVVESGTDAVAVVDLESGKCDLISPPHPGWKSRVLPAWRTATELSFAALDPLSGKVRWVIRREAKIEDLSADWPEEATADWLEFKETAPAELSTP